MKAKTRTLKELERRAAERFAATLEPKELERWKAERMEEEAKRAAALGPKEPGRQRRSVPSIRSGPSIWAILAESKLKDSNAEVEPFELQAEERLPA